MKLPTFRRRFRLRLIAPVAFDADVLPAGSLVEVSREQATTIIFAGRAAFVSELAPGTLTVVRRGAVVSWPDEGERSRTRKPWRPRNAFTRAAPRGSVRIDAGGSILEQVREFVGR